MPVQDSGDRPEAAGPTPRRKWITGREVAEYYSVDPATVRKWRINDLIPYEEMPGGKRFRYPAWLVEDGMSLSKLREWRESRQNPQAG